MKPQDMEANIRASKQYNISKHIEQNIKNDDSIVKITHTHITYTHRKII